MRVQLAGRGLVGGAVEDLSSGWIDLLGEEEAGGVFHLFEEGEIVVAQEPGRGSRTWGLRLLRPREGRSCKAGDESSTEQLCCSTSRDVGAESESLLSFTYIVRLGVTGLPDVLDD